MAAPQHLTRRRASLFSPFLGWVESAAGLDPLGKVIGKRVRRVTSHGLVKEALSGTWLGHSLHPALTDVVVGSFLSATLLDLFDQRNTSQARLISIGLLAAGPTALTGANDWADTEVASDAVRRAGLVHAVTNTGALVCYVSSLAARRRGAYRGGALLGFVGAALLMASAYLGGHLSFSRGVGPDQTVFDPGPTEWTEITGVAALPQGQPTRVVVEDTPVLLLRDGDRILALHDRCSHRGCSLSELGEVDGDHIICGCHGSAFDLRDGSIQRGPATAPQPAFEVRERNGRILLRRLVT